MHYHAEIWIPDSNTVEACVKKAMRQVEHDWYQIGGRWKGIHLSGYNQDTDPENQEKPCEYCEGTGFRGAFKCGGCNGTGIGMKWPTEWKQHPRDIIPVGEISETLSCHTLVLPKKVLIKEVYILSGDSDKPGRFVKSEEFLDGKVKSVLEQKGIRDGYLVTVDYHS